MRKRKAGQLWNKLFGLKAGDRVIVRIPDTRYSKGYRIEKATVIGKWNRYLEEKDRDRYMIKFDKSGFEFAYHISFLEKIE